MKYLIALPYVFTILNKFDELDVGEVYVTDYVSSISDFAVKIVKNNERKMTIDVVKTRIDVYKRKNEFKIIVNDITREKSLFETRYLNSFLGYDFKIGKRKYGVIYNNSFYKLDDKNLEIIATDKNTKRYIFLDIMSGFKVVKINGKDVTYFEKKFEKMSTSEYILLKNRKLQYDVMRMLLQKGIMRENFDVNVYRKVLRLIAKPETWSFSNVLEFNHNKINFGRLFPPNGLILVDVDYDKSNQLLLKFIFQYTPLFKEAVLCGIDYADRMWCVRLPRYMMYWKIKTVYKKIYQLDDKTKIFEF
ncbi:hypothetical protein AFV8_gp23 [Betalipothrixvirus puteoliense]|uniref:Uncharacterized protein n=1 Tax=Betalipothrixvirus puteoliense TaxID=346884 RepID=A7WKV3_9VIRU|nr:hypothetical protein AFV8_gp23 [Acidianus filamentous virus 8]CAJ31700.1 conserved hypothetical protein [Acidianus filamentous virus 8]